MGIEHESVVDHPLTEVFDWHTRPGAMRRLVPPWQPMKVVAEADSLADGRAVLGLPGGLRWVAQHDPTRFDPPHRFVDVLSSAGPDVVASADRRTLDPHARVRARSPVGTRVYDRIDAPVPAAALRPMFVYRHRQLADDLAAHRDARDAGLSPLVVAVTGATGLVGTALSAFLSTGGHRVIRLVRHPAQSRTSGSGIPTAPRPTCCRVSTPWSTSPGASIAGRFTDAHKEAVRDSRIGPTRRLAEVAADGDGSAGRSSAPRRSASTGSTAATPCCARKVCAATVSSPTSSRTGRPPPSLPSRRDCGSSTCGPESCSPPAAARCVCCVRCSPPGLGGRVGSGRQWLSWIALDDLLDVYYRALYDARLSGPVNAVAPAPVRNADYTKALAGVLHRPALLPVPSLGPRLLLGEQGSRELAEADQRVAPTKLETVGHRFRHPPHRRRARSRAGARLTDDVGHETTHQIAHPR